MTADRGSAVERPQGDDLRIGIFPTKGLWQDLGIRYLRIQASWKKCPKEDGKYKWDKMLDKKMDKKVDGKPVKLLLMIKCGNHGEPSDPPADLKKQWDSKHGHSESYYDWVFNLVKEFGSCIEALTIENEVNEKQFWTGTVDEYLMLLKTAYKAAHDAKPDIVVTDSGFPSSHWVWVIAQDRLKSGAKPEDVLRFVRSYLERREAGEAGAKRNLIPGDVKDLRKKCESRNESFIRKFFKHAKGSVDWINFHYYEPPELLDDVIEWLRAELKDNGMDGVPLMCNEFGIRKKEGAEIDFYLKEVTEKLRLAKRHGLKAVAWFTQGGEKLNIYGFAENDKFQQGFKEIIQGRAWEK
jgi:hypothetical protein